MWFEVAEVPDGNGEARAFRKMAGRVPVPLHLIFLQCESREGVESPRADVWVRARPPLVTKFRSDRRFNLPLLDEPVPAAMGQYSQPHTKAWAAKIEQFDAFVFVTPEYNHGPSPALKNAIDFLHREWNNKAVGFVGYGGNGGARSVEILSQVVSNVELADMRAQVGLSLFTDFENFTTFKPGPHLEPTVTIMLDQVTAWGGALKPLRTPKSD